MTKYKSRRRAAELKLEAAQQNLTRVDDIVFEVEKQRGALKRQAAKARRYRRLREELRRWEKVQFAQRYRVLGDAIESARAQLADARARETAAAAHVSEVEAMLERLRLELTEADSRTTAARETAHAHELEIGRLQQQIEFDKQQIESLAPPRQISMLKFVRSTRGASPPDWSWRHDGTRRHARWQSATRRLRRFTPKKRPMRSPANIEGLEADVEAARSEVFAAVNAATALRHAMEHAAGARTRIAEQIGRLDVERTDLDIESERAPADRNEAESAMRRAHEAMESLRLERAAGRLRTRGCPDRS